MAEKTFFMMPQFNSCKFSLFCLKNVKKLFRPKIFPRREMVRITNHIWLKILTQLNSYQEPAQFFMFLTKTFTLVNFLSFGAQY